MILIVGLGNPGEEYKNTRHNIGREIARAFQKKLDLPDFKFEKKLNSEITSGKLKKEQIQIILPNTYMNKSGTAVISASRSLKIRPADIFLIHDDADLVLGKTKLSYGKHSAGHKGVESVIKNLKTRDFWRFRIGIAGKKDISAEKLVLKKFTPQEEKLVKKVGKKTVDALKTTILEGTEKTMNYYNK